MFLPIFIHLHSDRHALFWAASISSSIDSLKYLTTRFVPILYYRSPKKPKSIRLLMQMMTTKMFIISRYVPTAHAANITTFAKRPNDHGSTVLTTTPDLLVTSTAKIVCFVSVLGYLFAGLIVLVFFNRAPFSFVPRWYKQSSRRNHDKMRLIVYYLAVFSLWPCIMPIYAFWALIVWTPKAYTKCSARKKDRRLRDREGEIEAGSGSGSSSDDAKEWTTINLDDV
jgi:hypothetical protein